jgi:hypothetical protein
VALFRRQCETGGVPAQRHHLVELSKQFAAELLDIVVTLGTDDRQATVVRQIHARRLLGQQAFDRGTHGRWIELHRRRGGQQPNAGGRVELPVRQAEGVAGEEAAAAFVPDAMVVAGVARRVEERQRPLREVDHLAVGALHHPLSVHRNHRAVGALHLGFAVDCPGAGKQQRRIDQVSGAARVHHHPRRRQRGHQRTGTAGVVEVHMRRNHPVHRVAWHAGGIERRQQPRHRVAGTGVDEGCSALLDDQVRGVELRSLVAGVDCPDAVAEGGGIFRAGIHGVGRGLRGVAV